MILVKLLTISAIFLQILVKWLTWPPSIEEEPEAVDLNEEAPQDALPEEPAENQKKQQQKTVSILKNRRKS